MDGQSSFIDAFLPAGFGRNERLERISALLDWSRIAAIVAPVRSGETGRPPYRPLPMFKALLLQQWYGLSDPGLEEALGDRVSFRRFCGFALDEETPDGEPAKAVSHVGRHWSEGRGERFKPAGEHDLPVPQRAEGGGARHGAVRGSGRAARPGGVRRQDGDAGRR